MAARGGLAASRGDVKCFDEDTIYVNVVAKIILHVGLKSSSRHALSLAAAGRLLWQRTDSGEQLRVVHDSESRSRVPMTLFTRCSYCERLVVSFQQCRKARCNS